MNTRRSPSIDLGNNPIRMQSGVQIFLDDVTDTYMHLDFMLGKITFVRKGVIVQQY